MASSVSKALVATEDCVGDVDVEVTPHPSNVPQFRRVDSVVEEANWRYDVFRSGCVGHGSSSVDYQPMSVEGSPLCRRLSVKSKLIACDFWKAVRPFSQGDWKNAKVYKKIIFIIKSPILMVFNLTIPTVNLDVENNNWSQPLTMVQCILAPLFLLFAIKISDFDYMIYDDFSLWLILFLAGILMAVLVFTTSDLAEPPAYHKLLAYVGFVMSVLWIYSLATEVVGIITTIGAIGRVPEELLGLTVLAWSNSLGDLFTDVTVARQGFPRMAISACFGGPLFNVLLGIGIPLTIASIRNGNVLPICFNSITLILIIFLIWSLLSSIILLPLSRFHATRPYACYLLVVYATFLVVASFTAVRLIPEFSVPRI